MTVNFANLLQRKYILKKFSVFRVVLTLRHMFTFKLSVIILIGVTNSFADLKQLWTEALTLKC